MRAAPAVSVRGAGGPGWRLLQTVLPALAAAVLAAWWLLRAERPALPAGLVFIAVAALAWRQSRPRVRQLAWDGQCWTVDGVAGRLAVMVDIGPALLLRLRPAGRGARLWVAVTAAEAGPAWHALRAAVYSRPPKTSPRVLPPERAAD